MTIKELANKPKFKLFMSRLYGWGASLVILGALFKIEHWEGSSYLLATGLITEAVIFFFSVVGSGGIKQGGKVGRVHSQNHGIDPHCPLIHSKMRKNFPFSVQRFGGIDEQNIWVQGLPFS